MNDTEVIIVGAGPVGLLLAAELRLAGVRTLVLEQLAEPSPYTKAGGLHARTLEQLAMRELTGPFLEGGVPVPAWHFGFLEQRLDLSRLDSPYPYMLAFPQHRTEAVLQDRAIELGVDIRRGVRVTGLHVSADGVRVTAQTGDTFDAGWVVGADGPGSAVRKLAGIGFPGTDADISSFVGDVRATTPPRPGYGVQNERGALIVAQLSGGLFRFAGYDPAGPDRAGSDLTLDELRETVARISGQDFGLHDPAWLSRFGNATRVAEAYRRGRVLLAGDAAHMHAPAGGVGLNLGLQDAMNLGWKLAAVAQGRADAGLLDTYHDERHPWGHDVGEHTMAQTALITATAPTGQALRRLLADAIATVPELSLRWARRLAGLDVRYGTDPLVGTRVAEISLPDGRPGHLDLPGLGPVLVRPDGYVWSKAGDTPEPRVSW
ncbi:FAD-dependent monooxygenase [Actinoplanes sp. NPDC049265]|uniref:FAD-dependent monooxygenase n=1 Tax=Actinoplanes sp. NPDC049265 TaxID=3363902 RepID=UPI003719EA8C